MENVKQVGRVPLSDIPDSDYTDFLVGVGTGPRCASVMADSRPAYKRRAARRL